MSDDRDGSRSGRVMALGLVSIVMMLILPIPAAALDLLLSVSVTFSLVIFLLAINFGDPLEFSSFPTILLVAAIFRLALNIASTRLILLHGHEGADAAGNVIQAFGQFVVGGSYIVGVIIFTIVIVINFKVITAGASRIAEVAARFTLDAMPGKQMAIDNDLANGHITEEDARTRRQKIMDEADFYGAMDGANKFVKGDAVAGVSVTFINIIGGIVIAVVQRDMSLSSAVETYTILTVGDGLVSQIPALLVSTSAGLIATRTASGEDLGTTLVKQLFTRRDPLAVASMALAGLALVPGMPTLAFGTLASGCFYLSRRKRSEPAESDKIAEAKAKAKDAEDAPLTDLLRVDLLALEVGFDLVPLVDRKRGGELIKRIGGIRKQLASELGIVVPPVHVRDNLRLASTHYRLLLSGTPIGEGDLQPGRLLAINASGSTTTLQGDKTKEPAFGMPAVWITTSSKDRAELVGYTVVDPATVAATHLTELIRKHAHELLGRTEAQDLINAFSETNAKVVEEVIPALLPLGDIIKILKNLLQESVSVRDLRSIFETIADHAGTVKDTDILTELVRSRLARQITARFSGESGELHALVLGPDVESAFRGPPQTRNQGSNGPQPDPSLVPRVISSLDTALRAANAAVTEPVLITTPDIRRSVSALVTRHAPGLAVLSFAEIDPKVSVKTLGVVKLGA